jgi:GNAT superfamily N-acetyltransferase
MVIIMKENSFIIREATENDANLIYNFILEMAEYENEINEVKTDIEKVKNTIINKRYAEGFIGEYEGLPIAYAIIFHSYSTYMGKPTLYLEDLFVKLAYRGRGFGKAMLSYFSKLAIERDCARFDWSCLDWNERSINFYKSLGAVALENRTIYRLHEKSLKDMANI